MYYRRVCWVLWPGCEEGQGSSLGGLISVNGMGFFCCVYQGGERGDGLGFVVDFGLVIFYPSF